MILLLICACSISAWADGGGEKKNPLTLESSNPLDGQKDVVLQPEIKLVFSKNVVNMKVKDNNEKCFKLLEKDGNEVPVEVKMADDQIEREKRNDIFLVPLEKLQPDTTYLVKISSDVSSKSGVTLGKEMTITFSTETIEEPVEKQTPEIQSNTPNPVEETGGEKKIEQEVVEVSAEVEKKSNPIEKESNILTKKEETKPIEEVKTEKIVEEATEELESKDTPNTEESSQLDPKPVSEDESAELVKEEETRGGFGNKVFIFIGLILVIGLGYKFRKK